METIFYIKAVLVAFQWFAFGLQIGFDKAKDNYKHIFDLTDDTKTMSFLSKKIENAKNAHSICFVVIVAICIIVLCL